MANYRVTHTLTWPGESHASIHVHLIPDPRAGDGPAYTPDEWGWPGGQYCEGGRKTGVWYFQGRPVAVHAVDGYAPITH